MQHGLHTLRAGCTGSSFSRHASSLGRVGFVGCGTIATSIVEGLCKLPSNTRAAHFSEIVVSPRNATKGSQLVMKYPDLVSMAVTNQDVIDTCDTVFLALTPQMAVAALEPLEFCDQKLYVSLMHGVSPTYVSALGSSLGSGELEVVRVNPLPAVAHHKGIAAIFPPHEAVSELFGHLGAVFEVDSLEQFHRLHSSSALMGPLYQLMGSAATWLEQGGFPPHVAKDYVGALFECVVVDSATGGKKHFTFQQMVDEQTNGGLNEQAVTQNKRIPYMFQTRNTLASHFARFA